MTEGTKPRVFIALRLPPEAMARLQEECTVATHDGGAAPTKPDLLRALGEVEGLLGSAMLPIDAEVIAAAPKLRVVSNFGVGFDNVDLAIATSRGVLVCNTPGVLSAAVADLTMALVVSLSRRLPEAERFVREGRWMRRSSFGLGADVGNKKLGIIGLGRIGGAVARRARAFDMEVLFHDLHREAPEEVRFCVYRDLDELLRESDFVSLHLNMTADSVGIIGARELGLMKPTAYLINTARGQLVDQPALTETLQERRIAGAALDVLVQEPPPPDDPLLRLPNVVVLPHIGSATAETRQAMRELAIDNLLAALRGETPPCLVNPEALGRRKGPSP